MVQTILSQDITLEQLTEIFGLTSTGRQKFVTTSEQKGDKEDKEDKGEILGGELFPSCCTSTHDNAFFPEWLDNLPPITDFEKQQLDRVKRSYISRVERHPLSENLVKMNSIKSSVSSKNWVN